MKSFIVPFILWGYVLSVVTAKGFWGGVYDRLIVALDLSPSQSWVLPICLNLAAALVGLPQVMSFIAASGRRDTMRKSRYVGSLLCIIAVSLCIGGTALAAFRQRQQLVTAAAELRRNEEADIFAAGQFVDGLYSNRVLGVAMQLPGDWQQMSLNTIRRARQSGAYAVAGGDTQKAEVLAAKPQGVYLLLAVRRYSESFKGYNPSLALSAYEKQAVAATGLHSLQEYVSSFIDISEPYHVRSGPVRERFGSEDGYHVHLESIFPGATIQQHVFATETEKFYLVLTASVIDEADFAVLRQAISTLQVTRRDD